jgi:hypothetical protein
VPTQTAFSALKPLNCASAAEDEFITKDQLRSVRVKPTKFQGYRRSGMILFNNIDQQNTNFEYATPSKNPSKSNFNSERQTKKQLEPVMSSQSLEEDHANNVTLY